MSKQLVGFGILGFAVCVTAGSAEAKLVRYEIDGKRYSYSTNNHQQVREARQRIEAANAAKAAKARADAEVAENPFVRIFGSPTQRQAAEAQARIGQSAAHQDNVEIDSTSSVKSGRGETRRSDKGAKLRVERRRALREARLARHRHQKRASLTSANRAAARKEGETSSEAQNQVQPVRFPEVESTSGIGHQPSKTAVPERSPAESVASSLTDFVNQVRKASPEN
jgi:hypothetical protein